MEIIYPHTICDICNRMNIYYGIYIDIVQYIEWCSSIIIGLLVWSMVCFSSSLTCSSLVSRFSFLLESWMCVCECGAWLGSLSGMVRGVGMVGWRGYVPSTVVALSLPFAFCLPVSDVLWRVDRRGCVLFAWLQRLEPCPELGARDRKREHVDVSVVHAYEIPCQ